MSKYPPKGPFNPGGAPPIDTSFLNNVETYLGYAADSNITADGSGNLTVVKVLLTSGSLTRISHFSGTGDVSAAAHGLGTTPDLIMITYAGNFGSPPTNPPYSFGANSTTVHVVGQGGYSWQAVAFKF